MEMPRPIWEKKTGSESGVGLIPNVTKIRGPTSDERRQRLEFHHGVAGHFKWLASTGMVPVRMPQ